MPPKVGGRRGAAKAKAAAKGRARALARLPVAPPRVRRRPAGEEEREDPAVLRRPAGREVLSIGERFERGESVNVVELPRHLIRPGQSLIVVEGNYWEAPVTLCGTVERVEEDGAGVVVEVRLSGREPSEPVCGDGSNLRRKYRELWLTGCVELPIQRWRRS